MVVLAEGAIAKEVADLVVDLEHADRPVRVDSRRDDLADRVVPAPDLLVVGVAGVRGDGEHPRREEQHHGVAPRRPRLDRRVVDDALGEAEPGELGVDVRARPHEGDEVLLGGHVEEGAQILALVTLPEIELARRGLVHAPRHVRLDDRQTHGADRAQAVSPVVSADAPVVHGARAQWDLSAAESERGATERSRTRIVKLFGATCWPWLAH